MTVENNTSRNQYTATSGQTVFAYTFEIVDKDDIVVLKNGTALSEGTDYTVSNVGNDSGGNVTLTTGATTGDILTLYRDMPYARNQNYTNSGDFLASEVNSDFDNLWLAGEQTQRSFSQSIRKPITDSDSISMELPEAADRANKVLSFTATGAVSVSDAPTDAIDASDVSITDAGGYYTSDNVEGALQEVGADITTIESDITTIESDITTIQSDITTIESDITTIQSDITTIESDITTIQSDIDDLETGRYLSVTDFGATGDGTTDDTTAIQNAINHASTRGIQTIFFPAGHYIYSTLRVYHDVTDNPAFQGNAPYTGDGSTTEFSFGWYIENTSRLTVRVDGVDQVLGTDYTVSGVGSDSGGTVTFTTAPADTLSVVIFSPNRDGRFEFRGEGRLAANTTSFYDGTNPQSLYGSILDATGDGLIVEPTQAFDSSDARNFTARDMTFFANNTGYIITSESCPLMNFDNCTFRQLNDAGSGLRVGNSWFFTFTKCVMYGSDKETSTGDGINCNTGPFAGLWNIKDCSINEFKNGIRWTGGTFVNVSIRDTAIQNCNQYHIFAEKGKWQQLLLDNAYFENIGLTAPSSLKIGRGEYFTATASQTVFTWTFDSPSAASFIFVYQNGTKLATSAYSVDLVAKTVTLNTGATVDDEIKITVDSANVRQLTMTNCFQYGPGIDRPMIDANALDTVSIDGTYVFRCRQTYLNIDDVEDLSQVPGEIKNCVIVTDTASGETFSNSTTATASQTAFTYDFSRNPQSGNYLLVREDQDFTGDGSTTVFTYEFSDDPTTSDDKGLEVYVDGTLVPSTRYTLDATAKTVTFDTAPANNDSVRLRVFMDASTTSHTGDGSTTQFVGTYARTADFVEVTVDGDRVTNYTLAQLDDPAGVQVNFTSAPANNADIKIVVSPYFVTREPVFADGGTVTLNTGAQANNIIRISFPQYLLTGKIPNPFNMVYSGHDKGFYNPNQNFRLFDPDKTFPKEYTEYYGATGLSRLSFGDTVVKTVTGTQTIRPTNGRTYYEFTHSDVGGLAVSLQSGTNAEVNDGRVVFIKNNENSGVGDYKYILVRNSDDPNFAAIAQLSPGQTGIFVFDGQNTRLWKYMGRTFSSNLEMADNQKIALGRGTASNSDMEIYHDSASGESRIDTLSGLTLDGLTYPTADGTDGQVLTTDGDGTLSFADAGGGFDPNVDNPTIGNGASAGTDSVSIGHDAIGSGASSVLIGQNADGGTSLRATGVGSDVTANGADSVAVGHDANAESSDTAVGAESRALSAFSCAFGKGADALASSSVAVGYNSSVATIAGFGVAVGRQATVGNDEGVAIGYLANAGAANTLHINAAGVGTNAPATAGHMVIETDDAKIEYDGDWDMSGGTLTLGDVTYPNTDGTANQVLVTDGDGTLSFADPSGFDPNVDNPAIGNGASAGTEAVSIGHDAGASGNNSISIGRNSDATQTGGVAVGAGAQATGSYSTAINEGNATGANSISIGPNSDATNTAAIAIGKLTNALGSQSIAIGDAANANAAATTSLAIGDNARVDGIDGVALGAESLAFANNTIHINASGASTNFPSTAGNMVIETDDARLQYKSSTWGLFGGNVEIDNGNLVLGTSGNGIDFSANPNAPGMTSELLDDYEEGDWTPTFSGATTTGAFTYSTQVGKYTKIGRQVIAVCEIQISAITTAAAGNLRIDGLPFSNSGGAKVGALLSQIASFGTSNNPSGGEVSSAGTRVLLKKYSSADPRDGLTAGTDSASLTTTARVRVTVAYNVA